MSINIVDRRKNSKGKSSENRQRLLKRVEDQIKKALPDIVKNTNVKDLTSSKDSIKVPVKGIGEPQFHYDKDSGDKKHVHPGNKEYSEGDIIKKPQGGQGKGKGQKGSKDGDPTEDEFTVSISKDEFLDYFFADLELPDMVKKHLNSIVDFKQRRAGYSNYGNPSKLNITRSYKNSMARRMAVGMFFDKKIDEFIYETMAYIAMAGLGVTVVEKFSPKQPSQPRPEINQPYKPVVRGTPLPRQEDPLI